MTWYVRVIVCVFSKNSWEPNIDMNRRQGVFGKNDI